VQDTRWNKTEPILRVLTELSVNYSRWMGKPIVHPGADLYGGTKDVGEYILRNMTPYGSLAPRRAQVRTTIEKIIPLLGMWVRYGMLGGEASHWMIKYSQEKDYARDKLDDEIAKLIQSDDIFGAIQEMVESGRYSSGNAVARRITQYDYVALKRFDSWTKSQQADFLNYLEKEEKGRSKKFMEKLSKIR